MQCRGMDGWMDGYVCWVYRVVKVLGVEVEWASRKMMTFVYISRHYLSSFITTCTFSTPGTPVPAGLRISSARKSSASYRPADRISCTPRPSPPL